MALGTTERLLRRTRRRLFVTTMGMLALLVVGVGTATAIVGLRALDVEVDRALRGTVEAQAAAFGNELPTSSTGPDSDEQAPGGSDTFLLVLNRGGAVVQNRTGYPLKDLPVAAALGPASAAHEDLRTVQLGGLDVRLLTIPLTRDGEALGYIQAGFVLSVHDRQSVSLILTIIAVGAAGLVAAAFITLLVTGRALVPIREGFEAQRRFVADASHELRTPAALIRANAEVLQREALVAEDGRPLIEDVIAEADRLGGLVGDLLQLAAWDETRMTVVPTALDAASLAADTVRGANALAAERGVRLQLDAVGAAPVTADRDRLVQLILILVDNAIDHSPRGGIVTVRVRRHGHEAVIDVDDQGPGIPESERERIFEPFTRLTGTTRHGSGGTGLGLAIARRIVDAHNGSIRASSPAGGGARFTVTLPSASSAATAIDRAARDTDADGDADADSPDEGSLTGGTR